MYIPVADLHTKVSGVPPQQDQILSFLHIFTKKRLCQRLAPPPMRVGTPPQWEILDPPLYTTKIVNLSNVYMCMIFVYELQSTQQLSKNI